MNDNKDNKDNKVKKISLSENTTLNEKFYDYYSDYRKSGDYFLWGSDNLAPQKIYELKYSSPTHAALIDLKIYMLNNYDIIGDLDELKLFNEYNKLEFNDLVKNIIKDYIIFSQFNVKVCQTSTVYSLLNYIPTQNLRYSTLLDEDGESVNMVISRDWSNLRLNENKKYILPIYRKNLNIDGNYIYHFRDDMYNNRYQTPTYFSALNSILLEDEILKFNLANTLNGWAPRLMVTFFGNYENNEIAELSEDIDRSYRGSENAGRVVYLNAPSIDLQPKIEQISYNLNDDSYVNLVISTKEYILSSHKCTSPALAGLAINGGFEGQGSALQSAYNIYDQLAIQDYRLVLNKHINNILKLSGWNFTIDLKLKDLKIEETI